MAEHIAVAPATGGAVSDLVGYFNFLIDPKEAASRLPRRFFWIVPFVVLSIVLIIAGVYNMPVAQQALSNQAPPPNVPPEQFQRMGMIGIRFGMYLSPVIVLIFSAISALVLFATSAVLDIKTRFIELFNFVLGLSIFVAIQTIVSSIIIHLQGEPSGLADLQPALGLDIFAPAGTNKLLTGFLGYFNIFQIWQMVMAALIIASAYRISKGRAAVLVAPMYVLGLILKVAGTAMQRTT